MLHLRPEIRSYDNGVLVNKNSTSFRDWVMLKLPCKHHRVADLKLLDYYFNNRIYGAYADYEIFQRDIMGYCGFDL